MNNSSAFKIAKLALAVFSLGFSTGCASYISDYATPADGRARAVWRDGEVAMEVANALPPACASDIRYNSKEPPPRYSSRGAHVYVHGGVWVPVYYGPRIVVVHHHTAPAPHVFHHHGHVVHRPAGSAAGGSSGSSGGGSHVVGGGGGSAGGGAVGGGGGGSSGGGSGGDGDMGKAVVVLAVIALLALPAIAIGLSAGRTEDETQAALSIDRVNAYNDLARTPGSSCAAYPAGVPAQ